MRIAFLLGAVALAAAVPPANAAKPTNPAKLTTEESKTLYALGNQIGRGLAVFSLSKDELAIVQQGLSDSVLGAKPAVDVSAYLPKVEALANERREARVPSEKAKGKDLADKIAKEKGAKRFESGLVLKELRPGKGPSPAETDTVKVHYRGTLVDGTEFDSSYGRGEPTEFPLNAVIPCWTEGLQKMKVGGKAQLVCPSSIAYGDRGRPGIPGGATLVFEVELLDIVKP